MRRWLALVAVLVVAACGGGDGGAVLPTTSTAVPSTAAPSTAAPSTGESTTAAPTTVGPTTTLPLTTVPTVPLPPLLVVYQDGQVTAADGTPVDVGDGADLTGLLADHTGGVLFQHPGWGSDEWVFDEVEGRWVLDESAGAAAPPILWQRSPGAVIEEVVEPDGNRVDLIDTAVVDGRPILAYRRMVLPGGPEICGDMPGEFPYCAWVSIELRLILRDLGSGEERDLGWIGGWESDGRDVSLGPSSLMVVRTPYANELGEFYVTWMAPDGSTIEAPYAPAGAEGELWCQGCALQSELSPTTERLAYAVQAVPDRGPTGIPEVVLVDLTSGEELWRASVASLPRGSRLRWLDTDGERVVVGAEVPAAVPNPMRPTLRRGDTGPEVSALQWGLRETVAPELAEDGVFGATTEAAVRELQAAAGIGVDGIAGPATWFELYGPDELVAADPVLVTGPEPGDVTPIDAADPAAVLTVVLLAT